jgi:hypothetical protein
MHNFSNNYTSKKTNLTTRDFAGKLAGEMSKVSYRPELGYRDGEKGTHTSRTMMLSELSALLSICETNASKEDYFAAIIEDNALGKSTVSTRKLSAQRLAELYALDTSVPIFRLLRRVWDIDPAGQALSALLVALARDPLLRCTATSVLNLRAGESFNREAMAEALRKTTQQRLNEATLDKVVRNAASTWSQSGHLEGRTFKRRCMVQPTAGPVSVALFLGYLQGMRGPGILKSFWCQILDSSPETLARIASTASMSGMIRFRIAGDVIEIGFPDLLTANEMEVMHEPH